MKKIKRKFLFKEIAKLNKIINENRSMFGLKNKIRNQREELKILNQLARDNKPLKDDYIDLSKKYGWLKQLHNGYKESLKASQEHNKELNEDLKAHEIVSAEMCELLDFTNSASIADLKSKLVLLNFYTKEECLYKKMTKVKRQLIQSENNLTETTLKLEKNKELQSKLDGIKKVLK